MIKGKLFAMSAMDELIDVLEINARNLDKCLTFGIGLCMTPVGTVSN